MTYYTIRITCGQCLIGDFTVTIPSDELVARGNQLPIKCNCGSMLKLTYEGRTER